MFYVYLHRKKTTGEVFYVGKGTGYRAYQHSKRNALWNNIVKKHGYTIEIVQSNLQEWYAFELEKELIAYYGRRNLGQGTLVNLTDGGEGTSGYKYSEEMKLAMIKRLTENPSNVDRNVYSFVNYKTQAEFVGTRLEFRDTMTFDPFYLFSSNASLQARDWYLSDKYSREDIERCIKESQSHKFNNSTHSFIRIINGETFDGTGYDFELFINSRSSCYSLLSGDNLTLGGWTTLENYRKYPKDLLLNSSKRIHNGRADKTEYEFYNYWFRCYYKGTRCKIEDDFGTSVKELISGKCKYTLDGWCLSENKHLKPKYDPTLKFFIHNSGEQFIGSYQDFEDKYGYNIGRHAGRATFTTHMGWSVIRSIEPD